VHLLETRAKALVDHVPVRVIAGIGLEGVALADNVQREPLSSYEIAAYLDKLSHDGGVTGVQLARLVGKSTTWVSRKLAAFRGAGAELRAAWERGELAEERVQQLADQPLDYQERALAQAAAPPRGPAHRPGIDAVKDVLGEVERRPLPGAAQVTVAYAKGVLDALRWVSGQQSSEDFAKLVEHPEGA